MQIFVLGVGATGSLLIKLLVRHGHHVSCGDRDPSRARAFLGERPVFPIHRVNARNVFDIAKAAKGCHLLVNTCPAVVNKIVLRAALRLRVHYLDTASQLRQHPFRLRHRGLSCSPIAWANAQLAAIFVKHFPRQQAGVITPESLPAAVIKSILRDVRSRGIRLTKKAIPQKISEEMDKI